MKEEEFEFQPVDLPNDPCFCPQVEFNGKSDSLFFNDGVRKIDFILVYEDEDKKEFEKRHTFQRHKVSFQVFVTFSSGCFSKVHYVIFNLLNLDGY